MSEVHFVLVRFTGAFFASFLPHNRQEKHDWTDIAKVSEYFASRARARGETDNFQESFNNLRDSRHINSLPICPSSLGRDDSQPKLENKIIINKHHALSTKEFSVKLLEWKDRKVNHRLYER